MLTIENMTFSIQAINGGSDIVLITDIRAVKKFVNGTPTEEVEGIRYTCILPSNKYQQIYIKLASTTPVITEEELQSKGGSVKAKVRGFFGRFYNQGGVYRFTSKATALEVIA